MRASGLWTVVLCVVMVLAIGCAPSQPSPSFAAPPSAPAAPSQPSDPAAPPAAPTTPPAPPEPVTDTGKIVMEVTPPAKIIDPLKCVALSSEDVSSETGSAIINQEGPDLGETECSTKWIIGSSAAMSGIVSLTIRFEPNTPKDALAYVCKDDLGIGDYKSCATAGGIQFGKGGYFVNIGCRPGVKAVCTNNDAVALAKLVATRLGS